MPEHLRALIVILVLATVVFGFARKPVGTLVGAAQFKQWRNLWFGVTLVAFLAHSFWLYAILTGLMVFHAAVRSSNPVALFFILLFAVPASSLEIPGFGLINYLFALNHVRILELALLLPAFILLARRPETAPFGRLGPDKLIGLYMLLTVFLQLRETTFTDTARQAFYVFLDVFLPYFVISRALQSMQAFKEAISAFVLACLLLAAVGVFEWLRHWLLYSAVVGALDPRMGFGAYLARAGSLRAMASTGHSIPLGYVMVVGIGLFLYLMPSLPTKGGRTAAMAALLGGAIAALSRGPWVGGAVSLLVFISTGQRAVQRLTKFALISVIFLPLLLAIPTTQKFLDFLPFVGNVETANIDYREQLIDNALIVIERNLWFGSVNYRETPEMQAMMQGGGIIDIVNTYIGVALESGVIGLALFVGFFITVIFGVRGGMRSVPDKDDEMHRLGRSLFATLLGILVIIFTVSSITVIPVVYWSVAGLGVAYTQMVRAKLEEEAAT